MLIGLISMIVLVFIFDNYYDCDDDDFYDYDDRFADPTDEGQCKQVEKLISLALVQVVSFEFTIDSIIILFHVLTCRLSF